MKVTIAGTEESLALTHRVTRGFGKRVDIATIIIGDASGLKTAAYPFNTKAFKEVTIEDPTGTVIFAGRTRDFTTKDQFLVLECEGWLAQLSDVHIESYDTKEILKSGTTTREGAVGSVLGHVIEGCTVGGSNPGWTSDQWVGYAVVFPDKLGSTLRTSIEWCTACWTYIGGPYYYGDHTKAHTKDWNGDWFDQDELQAHTVHSIGLLYDNYLGLDFQTAIPKSSISSIDLSCKWASINVDEHHLELYNFSTSQYDNLATKTADGTWDEDFNGKSPNYVNTDGTIRVKQRTYKAVPYTPRNLFDYAKITVHYTGALIQEIFPITANDDNGIQSSSNFENAGVLTTDPFTICKKTSEHVKALALAYDVQKTINVTNVVATNNYKAREWKERTALEIIIDLAEEDQTDFWLDLTQKLYYNQSFGSPSKYVDDSDVIVKFSKTTSGAIMRNEAHVWGYKYPSPSTTEVHEVRSNQSSKDTFGITKTQVERDITIYTSIDAKSRGDSVVNKSGFPAPQYTLVLAGKKNADGVIIDVGDYINLNLSKYGSENLLVVGKIYDPISNETEYSVVKIGSAARIYPVTFADAMAEMGTRLYRLMVQAGQRT